jgi:hypothetical protein
MVVSHKQGCLSTGECFGAYQYSFGRRRLRQNEGSMLGNEAASGAVS